MTNEERIKSLEEKIEALRKEQDERIDRVCAYIDKYNKYITGVEPGIGENWSHYNPLQKQINFATYLALAACAGALIGFLF